MTVEPVPAAVTDREVLQLVLGMAEATLGLPPNPFAPQQGSLTLKLISRVIHEQLGAGR